MVAHPSVSTEIPNTTQYTNSLCLSAVSSSLHSASLAFLKVKLHAWQLQSKAFLQYI